MSAERRNWERDESLLALRLYCQTPFGKLHQHNPEIIQLAELINRTPSAVAMKAVNFAHLDPNLQRKGLSSVSRLDRELWDEFAKDSSSIALLAESIFEQRIHISIESTSGEVREPSLPTGPSESQREVAVRRVQGFFRRSVLSSYEQSCAISGLKLPSLLVASHIIPWKDSIERRADPRNGVALNGLYDKAFDRGFITFDEEFRVSLSKELKLHLSDSHLCHSLFDIEGRELRMPRKFHPDQEAMAFHREQYLDNNSLLQQI